MAKQPNSILDEDSDPLAPAAASAQAEDFRLFLPSFGHTVAIGGTGSVFGGPSGTHATVFRVLDEPGVVTLDGSFNKGGAFVYLTGDAADWTVAQSGSNAVFDDGDTTVLIPVGSGLGIGFDDLAPLVLRFEGDDMLLGQGNSQVVDDQPAPIAALVSQGYLGPDVIYPDGEKPILFLSPGSEVSLRGTYRVFGTAEQEHIVMNGIGSVILDGSFNAGGDTLDFGDASIADFTAMLDGLNVTLTSTSDHLFASIPVGPAGMEIVFKEGSRTLFYDVASQEVYLENKLILSEPGALTVLG